MYEHRAHAPLSRAAFRLRMLRHAAWAILVVIASLGIGMAGYWYFEPEGIRDWPDAFVNAAMLLGGMGPIHQPKTSGGKIFAGLYALYAGLLFIVVSGIVLAPVVHRVLHKFHSDAGSPDDEVTPNRPKSSQKKR